MITRKALMSAFLRSSSHIPNSLSRMNAFYISDMRPCMMNCSTLRRQCVISTLSVVTLNCSASARGARATCSERAPHAPALHCCAESFENLCTFSKRQWTKFGEFCNIRVVVQVFYTSKECMRNRRDV